MPRTGKRPAGSSEGVGQREALFGGLTRIGSNGETVNYPLREGFMEAVLLDVRPGLERNQGNTTYGVRRR